MKKNLIKLSLFLASVFLLSSCSKLPIKDFKDTLVDHQFVTATVGNRTDLQLEVVNTPRSIAQGLSGRDEIGADGMLFVFDKPQQPSFWMKEMKFDLDLVWIRDYQVVAVTPNVPAPDLDAVLDSLPRYSPSEIVDMVLEVPAGFVVESNLKMGSFIEFKLND